MVLRRLSGETTNTAPVMTLITQFGGGKTHTLTALYHLVTLDGAIQDEAISNGSLFSSKRLRCLPRRGALWRLPCLHS